MCKAVKPKKEGYTGKNGNRQLAADMLEKNGNRQLAADMLANG